MKKFLIFAFCAASAASLCGSCGSSKARISGRFIGSDAKTVYLEQVTLFAQRLSDSVSLAQDGTYRFDIEGLGPSPALYNILYDGERIPLFVSGGDRLTVGAVGSVIRNYTVEGSEESQLLCDFYRPYVAGVRNLDLIAASLPTEDGEERRGVLKRYQEEYYRIKREQLRFIVENKDRMAAVYALYQRIPGDGMLFSGDGDIIYYRTVADAVAERYPESPYVPALRSEVARMDARLNLVQQMTEAKYPDLEIPDMYGRKIRLSSLEGKVVLVDFWSAALGNSNALNAELKEIYGRYADSGFEIYQVSVDTSKQTWISTVQEQALPWISVCDLRGEASPAVGFYNVRKLPSNFLIDAEGNIVGKDLYGAGLEKRLRELLN